MEWWLASATENRGLHGPHRRSAGRATPKICLITTGWARVWRKNFGPYRPLIENNGKSVTKEEIEIFCLYLFNVITFHNTRHTHTHPFNGLFLGPPGWAGTRKVKPIWTLLKHETVIGSGISWAICKSASRSRQISMPVPHQAGCPSCRPTNSVKALKAQNTQQV